jgi:tRNA modification GTPase
VRLDLDGLPVIVSDTAGIREPQGAIEREGIRRTFAHARDADLVLWLSDATAPLGPPPAEVSGRGDTYFLPLASKIDIPGAAADGRLGISAKTAAGLPELVATIAERARERIGDLSAPAITRERHRQNLLACAGALREFMRAPASEHELRAEDLRRAVQAIGRITGRVDVEDVLGEIFARFCIGK